MINGYFHSLTVFKLKGFCLALVLKLNTQAAEYRGSQKTVYYCHPFYFSLLHEKTIRVQGYQSSLHHTRLSSDPV